MKSAPTSSCLYFCGFVCGLLPLTALAAEPDAVPLEATGIDLGDARRIAYVVRDKATWDVLKKSVGGPQMLPIGMPKGSELQTLDKTDFDKQMIVALFWGEMSFAGQGEKCWIESVTVGKKEITVDCRAVLWGGNVKAAYRAWPYHAKVIDRSDLPVTFMQSTEFKADPNFNEKDKSLGTIQFSKWKLEINVK